MLLPQPFPPRRSLPAWLRAGVAAILIAFGPPAALASGDGQSRGGAPPKASAAVVKEIRELAPLLESSDLEVARATAGRLIALGEQALVPFEEEMRRQRLAPNGQVKLVLLKLRSLREERLWTEAIDELGRRPREVTMSLRDAKGPCGSVRLKTRPAPDDPDSIDLEVVRTPQRKGAAPGEPPTIIRATLAKDRTLTPRRIRVLVGEVQQVDLSVAEHRLRGQVRGRDVDAPAPPPLALDWALPLVAELMPALAETELVLTLIGAEQGSAEGLLMLRKSGDQGPGRKAGGGSGGGSARERSSQGSDVELAPAAVGGPSGFTPRRFEFDEKGRLRLAELGAGLVMEPQGASRSAGR